MKFLTQVTGFYSKIGAIEKGAIEGMSIDVWFWIGYAIGFLMASVVCVIAIGLLIDKWYAGNLREDRSIPEEPYYFMEIAPGRLKKLGMNDTILLRVKREDYIQTKEG